MHNINKRNLYYSKRVSGEDIYLTTSLHTDEVQEIIENPPHMLLRWGITWILLIIVGIFALSAFIKYPDVIKTHIRITTTNAPKAIPSKIGGFLKKITVIEYETVKAGNTLAWLESTADHEHVFILHESLLNLQQQISLSNDSGIVDKFFMPTTLILGELQGAYHLFYQQYLNYMASTSNGNLIKKRKFLFSELQNIGVQRGFLEHQKQLQEKEFEIAVSNFERYERLAQQKVISPVEFNLQESVFLSKQYPLKQTESAILSNLVSEAAKKRELDDLDNQIRELKSTFLQSLNSLISEIEIWKNRHLILAPLSGTVVFAGNIQENQYIDAGVELFYINPGDGDYFGEVNIPQFNLGKIKNGQRVLVKLDSYPFEEFGAIEGKLTELNQVAIKDSVFVSKVIFQPELINSPFLLRSGLTGTAEIITQDATLLSRLYRNLKGVLNMYSGN